MACQASSKTISLILQESTRAQEPKPKSIPYLDKCITGFSNDPCFSYWRGDPIIWTKTSISKSVGWNILIAKQLQCLTKMLPC